MVFWRCGERSCRAVTALAKIETEDTAVATLKFLLGAKGTAEIAGFAVNQIRHWRFVDELASDRDVMEKFSANPPNVYGFSHQQRVINCLINQRAALVDGLEGRKSPELISALYESIETGLEVALRFATRLSRLGVVS